MLKNFVVLFIFVGVFCWRASASEDVNRGNFIREHTTLLNDLEREVKEYRGYSRFCEYEGMLEYKIAKIIVTHFKLDDFHLYESLFSEIQNPILRDIILPNIWKVQKECRSLWFSIGDPRTIKERKEEQQKILSEWSIFDF